VIRDWADDVRPYLRAANVFVLPSRSEGMSNVLLEAMAAGLPSIATRVGAAEAVITDNVDGILVAPASPPQLGDAVRRLCTDASLRERLGEAAARTIDERFSIATVTTQIEQEYREILRDR
jgi:glycosyltransferase involved in cell wall biosynthesis